MDDTISRQAAIEAVIAEGRDVDSHYLESERIIHESDAVEALSMLPSVQYERKEGWWEEDMQEWPGQYRCSECRRPVWFPENFCPNCGAKMRRKELNEQNFSSD